MSEADDFLAHYGVAGMKWGKHKAQTSGSDSSGPSRRDLKTLDKESRKKDVAARDAQIDKAREEYGANARKNYLDAKAQYKVDKVTIGKREAKKAFEAVKNKNVEDYYVGQQAKSGKETVGLVMATVGLVALSAVMNAAANQ
jgi:hypothetical protein